MNRPVKSFDAILNAVVMELQRSPGAKVKLTLEIEAEAPSGFKDEDVGVVRDNTKQLKFTPGSTGFSDYDAGDLDTMRMRPERQMPPFAYLVLTDTSALGWREANLRN